MPETLPFRAIEPYDWGALLTLIRSEFAYMEGRIDPPSSMYALTAEGIALQAQQGEIWVIEDSWGDEGHRPVACVFLTPRLNALYLGKLAVAFTHRGKGLARQLIAKAEERAQALGLEHLMLQTRVELTENHATFNALGFAITGTTSHEGYDRPTSITMQRNVEIR